MQISSISIRNFKTIRELSIHDIESALIVVGKNSTGKTVILHAILAMAGQYEIKDTDYKDIERNIEITVTLEITGEDMKAFHDKGIVSKYKRYEAWEKDFMSKLPSY